MASIEDLPPAMRAEVEAALARMRAEQEQVQAQGGEVSVTLSAIRDGVKAQFASELESFATARAFPRIAEACYRGALEVAEKKDVPREQVKLLRNALGGASRMKVPTAPTSSEVRLIEVIPCGVFTKHVVVLAETQATIATPAAVHKSAPGVEVEGAWRSLHFVRRDGSGPGSYEVQTVTLQRAEVRFCSAGDDWAWLPGSVASAASFPPPRPAVLLECYARPLLHFAFAELLTRHNRAALLDGAEVLLKRKDDTALEMMNAGDVAAFRRATETSTKRERGEPTSDAAPVAALPDLTLPAGDVLVCGMGANAIGDYLAALLPASVPIAVLELEPAVVACNNLHHPSLPGNVQVVVADAREAVRAMPPSTHSLIVLDCFDPHSVNMLHAHRLIADCAALLVPGGMLAVNAHMDATSGDHLWPMVDLFGAANVQVVSISGYRQALVMCFRPTEGVAVGMKSVREFSVVCGVANHPGVTVTMQTHGPVTRPFCDDAVDGWQCPRDVQRGGWLDPSVILCTQRAVAKPTADECNNADAFEVRVWTTATA